MTSVPKCNVFPRTNNTELSPLQQVTWRAIYFTCHH